MNESNDNCFECKLAELDIEIRNINGFATLWHTSCNSPVKYQKLHSLTSRFHILKRDKFTCQYCGAKAPDVKLEVDHRFPRSKGGQDTEGNLVTACFDCNRGKSDKIIS